MLVPNYATVQVVGGKSFGNFTFFILRKLEEERETFLRLINLYTVWVNIMLCTFRKISFYVAWHFFKLTIC